LRKYRPEIAKYLVEKSFDVTMKDTDGKVLLSEATINGNLAVIKYLVEKGCDINAKDNSGRTAFDVAEDN
jgi:ankyrin repeat protein